MANDVANEGPGSRYWVRSVGRAAEILELLAELGPDEGMSVTDIAASRGLSKSGAFALLQTLRHYGLVADDGEGMNRRYRLGLTLARWGERAQAQISLHNVAHPMLRKLSEESGMTARLAVFESNHAVIVDQVAPMKTVLPELRMGVRELPYSSGLGKAMLAEMPGGRVKEIVGELGLRARTSRTITDLGILLDHLEDIRKVGYAIDDEEDADGVFCVGSPLRDHAGECVGAISITGLKRDQPSWRYQELGRQVREAAATISRMLGNEPPAGG